MTNKIYSLFIGRFQPLHKGHKKLFQIVLNEWGNVLVGLRNTKIDSDNPYTMSERIKMFKEVYEDELKNERMKLIELPDIKEVCYGRKVGWEIRKITLDEETESISATKIREVL